MNIRYEDERKMKHRWQLKIAAFVYPGVLSRFSLDLIGLIHQHKSSRASMGVPCGFAYTSSICSLLFLRLLKEMVLVMGK